MAKAAEAMNSSDALGKILAPLVRGGEQVHVPGLTTKRHRAALHCAKSAARMLRQTGGVPAGAPAAFVMHWLDSIAAAKDETFQLEAQWSGLLAHAACKYRKPMDKLARKLAALTPTAAGLFADLFRHYPDPDADWAPPEDWRLRIEERMIAELEALPLVFGAFESKQGPSPHIHLELRDELRLIDLGGPATLAWYGVPHYVWARHWEWASAKWCGGGVLYSSRRDTVGSGNAVNILVRQGLVERYLHQPVIAVGPLPGEKEPQISSPDFHAALATKTAVELWRMGRGIP